MACSDYFLLNPGPSAQDDTTHKWLSHPAMSTDKEKAPQENGDIFSIKVLSFLMILAFVKLL